jgi:hypothetical protein
MFARVSSACPITKTPSWTAQVNTNNNTPMNTEVLWGGGLWWWLLSAGAPCANQNENVVDADDAVAVDVAALIASAVDA